MTEKPFTIKDYDEQILQPAIKRFAECHVYEEIMRKEYIGDLAHYDYIKPIKWQKFKHRLQDYHQRAKDIWTILRGRDIHENCGY